MLSQGEAHVGSAGIYVGSMRLSKYQHVGISNAKWSRWGLNQCDGPTRVVSHCSRI